MDDFELLFSREYLRGALVVSLLSVWVLVALFWYLNRYTRRDYFQIWTVAWLFYALWLTLGITMPHLSVHSVVFSLRQCALGIAAVFILWGGVRFMERAAPPRLFGLFLAFMFVWSLAGAMVLEDELAVQLPLFVFIGVASLVAGAGFYRLRPRRPFVGIGLMFLGFFMWGLYLITFPIAQRFASLTVAQYLVSAVLQLFIAVSMIILVLEEARDAKETILRQLQGLHSENTVLQEQVLSTEARCRRLFDQASLHAEVQQAYEELRQTRQSAAQQERFLALGQRMASSLAHDINNALSPILTFSELLLHKDQGLTEPVRTHLRYVFTAAQDIAELVARLSEFHRREAAPGQLQSCQLNPLVKKVIDDAGPRLEQTAQRLGVRVALTADCAEGLPAFAGDESELRECLEHLLRNSVDALPQGGAIIVRTRAFRLGAHANGPGTPDHLALEVSDNGIGMDEETRRRCLEPFFSTKGGSGMGLAKVYGKVARHGGKVEILSAPERGTTVRLLLPLREPGPAPPQSPPKPGAAPPNGLRILCVDDEPLLRELLREVLARMHNQVVTAESGAAAFEQFQAARAQGQPFDVVITDLGMPVMDGRQLAQKLKAASPQTPIIMFTGWGKMLDDATQTTGTVDAFISKPPQISEITDTLATVTHSGKELNQQNAG
jgi:signal transduction histidine kinase/CheY-like chemotaxis protein